MFFARPDKFNWLTPVEPELRHFFLMNCPKEIKTLDIDHEVIQNEMIHNVHNVEFKALEFIREGRVGMPETRPKGVEEVEKSRDPVPIAPVATVASTVYNFGQGCSVVINMVAPPANLPG